MKGQNTGNQDAEVPQFFLSESGVYILFISVTERSLQKGVKVLEMSSILQGSAVFRLSAFEPVSQNNNFKPCTLFILPDLPDHYASTFKDLLCQEEAERFSIPRPPLKEVNFVFR